MEKELILCIAGFHVKLIFSPTDYTYLQNICINQLKSTYEGFIVKRIGQKIDFTIRFNESLHQVHSIKTKPISYITILSEMPLQKEIVTYYHVSISSFSHILDIVITKLIVPTGGFTLHASACAANRNECYIFLGPSGAGKSTTISLLSPEYKILGDDRILIKKEGDIFYAYQAAFIPKDKQFMYSPKKYRIKKLLFLKKSKMYKMKQITDKKNSFTMLLSQLQTDKKEAIKNIGRFVSSPPNIYYLYFGKDRKKLVKLLS